MVAAMGIHIGRIIPLAEIDLHSDGPHGDTVDSESPLRVRGSRPGITRPARITAYKYGFVRYGTVVLVQDHTR